MQSANRIVERSPKITIETIRTLIVNNSIVIKNYRHFFIGAYLSKCLTCKGCVACGLPIKYARVMQLDKNAKDRLYFFGERENKAVLFTKDHCIPLARGGPNIIDNIQPMCCDCNNFKGDSLTMSPSFWALRKKIEYDTIMQKYLELYSEHRIDGETLTRRAKRAKNNYIKTKYKTRLLYNICE